MRYAFLLVAGALLAACPRSSGDASPNGEGADADGGSTGGGDAGTSGDAPASERGDARAPLPDGAPPLPDGGGFDAGSVSVLPCGGPVHCVGAGASVQAAVNAASDGDTIQVAGGTFNEDVLVQNKALKLVGGFDSAFATRDTTAHETVLRGTGAQSVVRLLADGKATRLDGFTIRGGGGNPGDAYSGAGVYSQNGTVVIANNHIIGNVVSAPNISMTDTRGGGILASGYGSTSVVIAGNVIESNVSGRGAGIASVGVATLVIQSNVVKNNRGYSDHGGGLFIMSPNATIRGNLVAGNEIGPAANPYGWGGGIFLNELGTVAQLSYNVVTGNKAVSDGSGVFFNNGAKGSLDHELYYANACTRDSSAAILVEATDPNTPGTITVNQSTVVDHPCQNPYLGNGLMLGSPGCRATITKSIFYNNGTRQLSNTQGAEVPPSVTDSWIDKDPQFVDPVNHDYHLNAGSPATGYGCF